MFIFYFEYDQNIVVHVYNSQCVEFSKIDCIFLFKK